MKVQEQWDFPKFSYCLISACVKDLANIMSVCRSFFLKGESNSIWTKSADACSRNWRIWQPWKLRKLTAIVTQISIDNRCGTFCTVFGKEKKQETVNCTSGPRATGAGDKRAKSVSAALARTGKLIARADVFLYLSAHCVCWPGAWLLTGNHIIAMMKWWLHWYQLAALNANARISHRLVFDVVESIWGLGYSIKSQ